MASGVSVFFRPCEEYAKKRSFEVLGYSCSELRRGRRWVIRVSIHL